MVKENSKYLKIGNRLVGPGKKCFIIAEAGSNHNGDIRIAKNLIDAAARVGADAVKFQLFRTEELTSKKSLQKAWKRYEFERGWLKELSRFAESHGIIFLATPFDKEAVDLLVERDVPLFKIASSDLTNIPLLECVAKTKKPLVISVGLANLEEIKKALNLVFSKGAKNVSLLHCVVEYPAKIEDLNLKTIELLRDKFHVPIGFSDHTMDMVIPSIAVSLGACIIEKHFTLSKKAKGPDHAFSLEPKEFSEMVKNIRNTEKSLGLPVKRLSSYEKSIVKAGRRGVYSKSYIPKNTKIRDELITVLRPELGISALDYKNVIGKTTKKSLRAFRPICWKDLKKK